MQPIIDYSSGNEVVDQIGTMDLSGNVIPNLWYSSILRENGKPYLLAILLLGEIVYWYKPVELRDDESGRTTGFRTRFKDDCLQKSYEQLADRFGESKQTIKRALDCLEKLGIIRRELRDVTVGRDHTRLNNVMFIHLIPEGLKRVTYPQSSTPPIKSEGRVSSNLIGGSPQICREAPIKYDGTNTENTTEITPREYSHPIYPFKENNSDSMDRMDETRELIKENIEYDALFGDYYDSDRKLLDNLVELMVETIVLDKDIHLGDRIIPHALIASRFEKFNMYTMDYVIRSLKKNPNKVRNLKKYLLAALYNATVTQGAHESMGVEIRYSSA